MRNFRDSWEWVRLAEVVLYSGGSGGSMFCMRFNSKYVYKWMEKSVKDWALRNSDGLRVIALRNDGPENILKRATPDSLI